MWMENGKNNKIKEQFKAEMSTTGHTLLPGSPAVHLVSLCLICGHLWCALSLSSHLVSPCAPAASTGASFADIFASRKVPSHWPCLPQAGARRKASMQLTAGGDLYYIQP